MQNTADGMRLSSAATPDISSTLATEALSRQMSNGSSEGVPTPVSAASTPTALVSTTFTLFTSVPAASTSSASISASQSTASTPTALVSTASQSVASTPTALVPAASQLATPVPASTFTVSSNSMFCSYSHRPCRRSKVQGYNFCIRHILEDKNAPYKACNYNSIRNGKKCNRPYLKTDKKDGLCSDHQRKTYQMRLQPGVLSKKNSEVVSRSIEVHLQELSHYAGAGDGGPPAAANQHHPSGADSLRLQISDWTCPSESEDDEVLAEHAVKKSIDSDTESIDSEQDDPLKYAGVYTIEEAARIAYEKLKRLQSLYKDQFRMLQCQLAVRQRSFEEHFQIEQETHGKIDPKTLSKAELLDYKKLMAWKNCRISRGQEGVVKKQYGDKRKTLLSQRDAGHHTRMTSSFVKCIHSDKKGRCGKKALPLTKHCDQHITEDSHQLLFTKCSGKPICRNVVFRLSKTVTCDSHTPLLPITDICSNIPEDQVLDV